MIAVIIGILAFIAGILLLIFGIKDCDDETPAIGGAIIVTMCVALILSLFFGMSIYKGDTAKTLAKKEQIEYLLENNISSYVIEQAQKYNKDIDFGNNLWCRFSIEDRSEFKIDIDKYLKKGELK